MGPIVIAGAGLAGLICANELHARGLPFLLLEEEEEVGGRIRTAEKEGFRFDRGFQILLAGYPWVSRYLNLEALDFRPVKSGALVWDGEAFHRLVDPVRHPAEVSAALTTSVITWGDRLRLTGLAARVYPAAADTLLDPAGDVSTAEYLAQTKFSEKSLRAFFRPFFGGVFLEEDLSTASSYFRFLFHLFGTGAAGVPAAGMGAIPRQLAARLPPASLRFGARVNGREGKEILLASGERIRAEALVCAGGPGAARALGLEAPARKWHASLTLYFAAAESPLKEGILALNGSGEGLVTNLLVMSDLAPAYAPAGQSLISVSLRPEAGEGPTLAGRVKSELEKWWGPGVGKWWEIGAVSVPQALPAYPPGGVPFGAVETTEAGVFLAGDLLTIPSQEGAARSGRMAAEAVARFLGKTL